MTDSPRIDLDELRRRVDLVRLIGEEVELKRRGSEHVGLCPFHGERTASFTVAPAKGFFHCFGCGAHGDAIGWIIRMRDLTFRQAVEELARMVGLDAGGGARPDPAAEERWRRERAERDRALAERQLREKRKRRGRALDIWRAARPAPGSPVETYLRHARAIDLDAIGGVPPSLRFHPALAYWHSAAGAERPELLGKFPAMIGGCQDVTGQVVAVHCTYLAWRGRGKEELPSPKKMIGATWGAAVRFARAAAQLGVSEGIETGLSVLAACRAEGLDLGVWAALSLGNISGAGRGRGPRHPDFPGDRRRRLPSPLPDPEHPGLILPPIVREVVILADADTKDRLVGEALLARAGARWRAERRLVRIARPAPGMDFNDMALMGPQTGRAA